MPWSKVQNHKGCPTSKPWAVVKDSDGSVAGCHPSEDAANKQIAALHANVEESMATKNFNLRRAIRQYQAGNAQALIDWYNAGADGQIDWGEPGDFEQCVGVAGDYVDDPEGFCQERHIDATGEPAGKGAHGGAGASMKTKQFALADEALGDGTGPAPNADAHAQLHNNIAAAVSDAHPHNVDVSSSSDPKAAGKITVVAKHDDGSTTKTTHVVGPPPAATAAGPPPLGGSGLALLSSDGDDGNDPDCEDAQIGAVSDALDASGVDVGSASGGTPVAPPKTPGKPPMSARRRTITADVGDLPEATVDVANKTFEMPIMVIEGIWTGDWRYVDSGSLSWRDLPIPAMALTKTTTTHDSADLVGKINSIERNEFDEGTINSRTGEPYPPGTTYLMGKGDFATLARAEEIAQLVADGFLRGVSVDIGDAISDYITVDENGDEVEDDGWDLFDLLFGFTADGEEVDEESAVPQRTFFGEKIRSGRIMGATICPFPAFEGAYVQIGDIAMAASAADEKRGPGIVMVPATKRTHTSLVAAAAPMEPPASWFDDPDLDGPTAIEIEKSGRFFGHLAVWSGNHIGYTNQKIKPPHSLTDYAYFKTGATLTQEGFTIPTGVITMNTGHSELWMESDIAKAHYDNTGMVVADVCAGEDSYGIWVAGALRPDVDELSIRRLRGASLSGDWRQIGASSELVAALAVNVPGFPIVRPKARVASGQVVALVAAGRITHGDAERLRRMSKLPKSAASADSSTLAAATLILERQARQQLRAEVHHR